MSIDVTNTFLLEGRLYTWPCKKCEHENQFLIAAAGLPADEPALTEGDVVPVVVKEAAPPSS